MDFNLLSMGQEQRFDFSGNGHNSFKTVKRGQELDNSMEDNGILFGYSDSMGVHRSDISDKHQQSTNNIPTFFNRLGNYNVHNIISEHQKMAAILIKISVFLVNIFGVSLIIWWLAIDFDGLKIFISSVGVFIYGGMKIYEKYLDLREKRRKDKTNQNEFNNHKK